MTEEAKNRIRVICLDFDGTCVAYKEGLAFLDPAVIKFLNEAESEGIRWCSNSGRTLESQLEVLEASRERGLTHYPEALMCGESFLYHRVHDDYRSNDEWNQRAGAVLSAFHRGLQSRNAAELRRLAEQYDVVEMVFEDMATAYLVPTDDQEVLNSCLRELEGVVHDLPRGFASRNGGWIFVGHRDFGKGRVLQAYLEELGLTKDDVIAVGDNLNDLDMLDGSVSSHVGCPGDAQPEVIRAVRAANGFVGTARGPAGTLEVIRHFLNGQNG